jgi:hypothetical protein
MNPLLFSSQTDVVSSQLQAPSALPLVAQTGSGVHSTCFTMGTGYSFSGGKAAGV